MAGAPARYLVFFQYFGTSGVMETKSDQALVGVQNYLEKAAEQLKPSAPIKFHISSRTDSGVHALANAAHLDIQRAPGRAPFTGPQLLHGLNHFLKPEPIRILSAQRVSSTFHARFCALSRTYIYRLLLGCAHRSQIPVFEQDLCWAPSGGPLDIPAMRAAARLLLGTHDFSTFRSPRPEAAAQSPVRTLQLLQLQPGHGLLGQHHLHRGLEFWEVKVKSKSFLYRQVERSTVPSLWPGAEDGGGPGGRGPGQVGPGAAAAAAGAQGPPGAAPARHGPARGALPAQRGVQPDRFGPSKCPSRRGALWTEPKGIYNINYKLN
ncbi:tRNA pseudouridine synthase-like 1 isoform X2 [Ammospiza nelsoni]|uniref:tRNA pseudouridine synthase-like 1 isoform X2 n=1 Tax=Ammospiza nelsoni TaxID=2857394 RepID=UPI00286D1F25|nr:tRNA pseudouridine synthase-like 1 isoform X2 [Ammospiza nelsoni]